MCGFIGVQTIENQCCFSKQRKAQYSVPIYLNGIRVACVKFEAGLQNCKVN
jgi:hypothetical protein